MFRRPLATQADMVGFNESTEISSHLQSYFIASRPWVNYSSLFRDRIGICDDTIDWVRVYGEGCRGLLADAGFQLEAFYLGWVVRQCHPLPPAPAAGRDELPILNQSCLSSSQSVRASLPKSGGQ